MEYLVRIKRHVNLRLDRQKTPESFGTPTSNKHPIIIQVTIQRKSILLRLVSKGVNVHIQTIRVGMIHVVHTVL